MRRVALVMLILLAACSPCTECWNGDCGECPEQPPELRARALIGEALASYNASINELRRGECEGCWHAAAVADDEVLVTVEGWRVVEGTADVSPAECDALGGDALPLSGDESCPPGTRDEGRVAGFIEPRTCCVAELPGHVRELAQQCGEPLAEHWSYNPESKTYWVDLAVEREGCACVVHENGSAAINWRCTGLVE